MKFSREELAWAAGLFDGEGAIGVHRHSQARVDGSRRLHIGIKIDQHGDPEVLRRFQAAVGIGAVYGPYRPKSFKAHWADEWQYRVTGFEKCQAVMAMLWPWLSGVKRSQAASALRDMRAADLVDPLRRSAPKPKAA